MHLGTNMATGNIDCSPQDINKEFARAFEFSFPDSGIVPDVGSEPTYLDLHSRMSSNINDDKNYSEQLTVEVLDNNTTLLNAMQSNENHILSQQTAELPHSRTLLDVLGLNENDILDLRSKDTNTPLHPPNMIQSVIPEEQLHINIETDEEGIHSWRPNLTSSLSSDFFVARPVVENGVEDSPNHHERHDDASGNVLNRNKPEVLHVEAPTVTQNNVQSVTNLSLGTSRSTHIDIQTYLQSQKAQLNIMKYEVINAERRFFEAKSSVEELTHKLKEKLLFQNSGDIEKLSEENAELRLECQCLCMEVDFYLKGQAPLGEIDEKFYRRSNSDEKNAETNVQSGICPGVEQQSSTEEERQEEANKWECPKCTFANHPAISSCEMCHMQRQRNENLPFVSNLPSTCYCHPMDEHKSS